MDLEELLVQEGVAAAPEQIRSALELAERDGRHPAAALVEEGIVSEDVLADLLARASGSVVVDFEQGAIDAEAPHIVSGTVAREFLLLPVAAGGGKVRCAFVNPLDRDAVRAVENASRLPVQPLVGTLSGLRQAIERAYAGRTTRVVREMPHEITRKVAGLSMSEQGTSPVYRLEEEATIEQRHEALLLALIERGLLTRADYTEALKRLLSGRRE